MSILNYGIVMGNKIFDLKDFGTIEEGTFIRRINRFVGLGKINGKTKKLYISDTGRLTEILKEGVKIKVYKNKPDLKTDYTLLTVNTDGENILINTSIHSQIGYNAINTGILGHIPKKIKKEVVYGNSRLDYLVDDKIFVELKGCNLKIGNVGYFPDAPTVRGVKHLKELIKCKEEGYDSVILIMVLRDVEYFSPNLERDENFFKMFYHALSKGVKYRGFKIHVDDDLKVYLKDKNVPLLEW